MQNHSHFFRHFNSDFLIDIDRRVARRLSSVLVRTLRAVLAHPASSAFLYYMKLSLSKHIGPLPCPYRFHLSHAYAFSRGWSGQTGRKKEIQHVAGTHHKPPQTNHKKQQGPVSSLLLKHCTMPCDRAEFENSAPTASSLSTASKHLVIFVRSIRSTRCRPPFDML
jgi:hypothetical protein